MRHKGIPSIRERSNVSSPWLKRWGTTIATVDIMGLLDGQTQNEIRKVASSNGIFFEEEFSGRNRQVYEILEHIGKLGIVLQYLMNIGMTETDLSNEFGKDPKDMADKVSSLGVSVTVRKRGPSTSSFGALGEMLDDMGISYATNRRITYTIGGRRYSVFPSFLLLDYPILIFVKGTKTVEKTGRQDIGLKDRGFKVIRFRPEEVHRDPQKVSYEINSAVQAHQLTETKMPYVIVENK